MIRCSDCVFCDSSSAVPFKSHVETFLIWAPAERVSAWTCTSGLQLEPPPTRLPRRPRCVRLSSLSRPLPATGRLLPHPSRSTIHSAPSPGSIVIARSASAAHNPLIRGKLTLMLASNEQCRKQPAIRKIECRFTSMDFSELRGVAAESPCVGGLPESKSMVAPTSWRASPWLVLRLLVLVLLRRQRRGVDLLLRLCFFPSLAFPFKSHVETFLIWVPQLRKMNVTWIKWSLRNCKG